MSKKTVKTTTSHGKTPLILASTSRHRQALLRRLGLDFDVAAPDIDEASLPGERPAETAVRLAEAKARAVAPRHRAVHEDRQRRPDRTDRPAPDPSYRPARGRRRAPPAGGRVSALAVSASVRRLGRLYVIPSLLGIVAPAAVLPQRTIDLARGLTHFVVETPKLARQFLKTLAPAPP